MPFSPQVCSVDVSDGQGDPSPRTLRKRSNYIRNSVINRVHLFSRDKGVAGSLFATVVRVCNEDVRQTHGPSTHPLSRPTPLMAIINFRHVGQVIAADNQE